MVDNKINKYLIPSLTKLPEKKQSSNQLQSTGVENQDDFKQLLKGELKNNESVGVEAKDLRISSHAAKRLKERNLNIDGDEFLKLKQALNKLKYKGGRDSLVITDKAAYIVDVNNSMIVTAMDKNQMAENVFTKIDSTLFMN